MPSAVKQKLVHKLRLKRKANRTPLALQDPRVVSDALAKIPKLLQAGNGDSITKDTLSSILDFSVCSQDQDEPMAETEESVDDADKDNNCESPKGSAVERAAFRR